MALADFLGSLVPGGIPQLPGAGIPQLPDMAGGIDQALQHNQQLAQQRQAIQRPQRGAGGGGIRDFLGRLGDALLVANGRSPIYAQRIQQRQEDERRTRVGSALAQLLGGGDASMAALFQDDPDAGLAVYKATHEKDDKPAAFDEFEHYMRLPDEQKPAYEKYLRLKHPGMMAPISLGPNDTLETPGQEAIAEDANGNRIRYNPQSGAWEPVGGPTDSNPSVPFP
jgi:hypothetical protein